MNRSAALRLAILSSALVMAAPTGRAGHALVRTFSDPAPAPYVRFGAEVAIVGEAVIVTAPHEGSLDPALDGPGAVHVFDGRSGALLRTLVHPEAHPDDAFGRALATLGDDVLIGADQATFRFDVATGALVRRFPLTGIGVTAVGRNVAIGGARSVSVFHGNTGRPLRYLPQPHQAGGFGEILAGTARRLFVAAADDSVGSPYSGAVYVYAAHSGDLLLTLRDDPPVNVGRFGGSLAPIGDDRLLVGTTLTTGQDFPTGAVMLYDTRHGERLLTLQEPVPQGGFGSALAAYGDDLLIGSPGGLEGAAYRFDGSDGALLDTFANPDGAASFGSSLASDGAAVVVGAPYMAGPGNVHLYCDTALPASAGPCR